MMAVRPKSKMLKIRERRKRAMPNVELFFRLEYVAVFHSRDYATEIPAFGKRSSCHNLSLRIFA